MHDIAFKNNRELSYDKLKEYAGQTGLHVARWEKYFNAPEVQQQIEKDMADGRAADVQGTPTFFVNGKRVSDRSLEGFKQMIDEALKPKGEVQPASVRHCRSMGPLAPGPPARRCRPREAG